MTIDDLTIGHPQRRGCKACFENGDDHCSLIDDAYEYPCITCIDAVIDCELIVPPKLKKVCERCKKKRISCSYQSGGSKGVKTCKACNESDATCCAVPLKDSSYSRRYDDVLDENGKVLPNVRRPPPASTSSTFTVAASSVPAAPVRVVAPRMYVSCNQCRSEGLKCTVKRDKPGPCSKCRQKGEECNFVLIRPAKEASSSVTLLTLKVKQSAKSGKVKQSVANSRSHEQSPEIPQFPSPSGFQNALGAESWYRGTGAGRRRITHGSGSLVEKRSGYKIKKEKGLNRGNRRSTFSGSPLSPTSPQLIGRSGGYNHIKINTFFSHPIKFNYIPSPDGTQKCSWCREDDTFFGLYGFGEKTVEVIPYPEGYEEIGEGKYRGWGQLGKEATNMCTSCTNTRMDMIMCTDHRMTLMDDQNSALFGEMSSPAWVKALEALANNDLEGGDLILQAKFCSICTSVAEYRCTCEQDPANRAYGAQQHGCGLLLCEPCNELMEHIVKGKEERQKWEGSDVIVLDRLISMVANGDGGGVDSDLRADASFLKSTDGELLQHLLPPDFDSLSALSGELSSTNGKDSDGSDGETSRIFERLGKDRGKWTKKQKPELTPGVIPLKKSKSKNNEPSSSTKSGGGKSKSSKAKGAEPDFGFGPPLPSSSSYNARGHGIGDFMMSVASGRKHEVLNFDHYLLRLESRSLN